MRIRIQLMGILKDKTPADGFLVLPQGAAIEDALAALGIQPDNAYSFTINNKLVRDRKQSLANEDHLTIVPPMVGG